MKLVRPSFVNLMTVAVAALSIVMIASTAGAFALRNPQVYILPTSLQDELNNFDGGVNVYTGQVDGQVWRSSVSGNATFTLMLELAGNAPNNAFGIYNIDDPNTNPALFQVFPGSATAGYFATAHFGPSGALRVFLYDNSATPLGFTDYSNVNRNRFGFYLDGPGGTFYSDDARNGGNAQAVTYDGTGANFGDWWEAFEDLPLQSSDADYNDMILLLQSVNPTPTHARTWGELKALYR
jgi:hypothetical protein